MFCPKGPVGIATNSNPASISLSGVDRDNCVIRVATSAGISGSISMGGTSFTVYGGVEYFRLPANASSVNVSTFAPSGQVEVVLGEDF